MAKKLYVGNLSYNTPKEKVQELFAQAGEVTEVTLITDRDTGRPKGFGFVEMATEQGAQEAIKRFNGYTLDNRQLTVNEARPREDRPSGGSRNYDRDGGNRRDRY
ncbi:MAG TPA: RNA-binding protein [Phototrophicaceae bacterium]|nr:RNA-binding protein [Phototrophicaceae bacterium]